MWAPSTKIFELLTWLTIFLDHHGLMDHGRKCGRQFPASRVAGVLLMIETLAKTKKKIFSFDERCFTVKTAYSSLKNGDALVVLWDCERDA